MQPLRQLQQRAIHQLAQTRPGPSSFRLLQQTSQQPFRTRPKHFSTSRAFPRGPRSSSSPFSRIFRRFQSSTSESTENLSLGQRLKRLSKDYGWSALGVYLALTALDLPFCFLAVRSLGTDRIGHWEHVIVSYIKDTVAWPLFGNKDATEAVEEASERVEELVKKPLEEVRQGEKRVLEEGETYVVADHGYKEAEKANRGDNASFWTQMALAYAIHKSFIFIRVPLTAAITPKVVKTLRGWGWNIGPKMPRRKSLGSASKSGVNTKGTGVKPDD